YQKSADLTCLTCHDPHAAEMPKDPVAFYRDKCLHCHTTQPCRLEPAKRLAKEPADNCAACHMPRGDTDIPHVAFTHHRIGKHSSAAPAAPADTGRMPELRPIPDVSHLSSVDQQRNLGLAYLSLLGFHDTAPAHVPLFKARARALLEAVEKAK